MMSRPTRLAIESLLTTIAWLEKVAGVAGLESPGSGEQRGRARGESAARSWRG